MNVGESQMEKENKKGRVFAYVVMGIYLLFLCWLILFKMADSFNKIPSMRSINLVPFYYGEFNGSRFQLFDIIYNILVFVPAGFYFAALGKKKAISGIGGCFILSLSFEVIQWVFAIGSSDITDLITNTAGGVVGTGIYFLLRKLSRGREIKIVSIIGAVIEMGLIGLLVLLFMSN